MHSHIKEFDKWNTVKKQLNREERKINMRAGEIRWVAFGINVGSEIDGKGVSFVRPALILSVSGSHIAFVIPMSTKLKEVAGYVPFVMKGKTVALCVHQARSVSQKRILGRMARISTKHLSECKQYLKDFFSL